jgi:hypothetical protein
LQNDLQLWTGCLSGALTEEGFLRSFAEAGFYGMQILGRNETPWATVEGIEFRSMTIAAYKGEPGTCLERNQAVIYLGPFKEILDDDNHRMERGRRYAVCDKTYQLYKQEPYRRFFAFVDPPMPVPPAEAPPFECSGMRVRHPRETKGQDHRAGIRVNQCCDGSGCP